LNAQCTDFGSHLSVAFDDSRIPECIHCWTNQSAVVGVLKSSSWLTNVALAQVKKHILSLASFVALE